MNENSARKIESVILRSLSDRNQSETAAAVGISGVKLSRWTRANTGEGGGLHLPEISTLLAALDLCLLESSQGEMVTIPRDEYDALRTLARRLLT